MAIEGLLHDAALNAFAPSMNQTNFAKASFVRRSDVLLDDRPDVPGRESVKVEEVFDGNSMCHVIYVTGCGWPRRQKLPRRFAHHLVIFATL